MRESDVDDIADEAEDIVHQHMADLRTNIETTWASKAQATLNTSREKYLDALSVELEGDKIVVTITGWLPVGVEQGLERFQMNKNVVGSKIIALVGKDGGETRFRTMKAGSAGWWHPGIIARKIHEQVFAEMESDVLPAVFVEAFSSRRTV